jgi:hypothetical protein
MHGRREPGFGGAFLGGPTISLSDDAVQPGTSPVQVFVVTDGSPIQLGTFMFEDMLMEVRYLSWAQLRSAEMVLQSYQLARNLRWNTILEDPTGRLGDLQTKVARQFRRMPWVRERCENARLRAAELMRAVDPTTPLADQVATWLSGMGAVNHILLVADLRHPVVRQSYLHVREVLAEYDRAQFYADLLELLGCVHLTQRRVWYHHQALAETLDRTLAVARSPSYFFNSHVSPASRDLALDGSRELLDRGYHREAMFWIAMMFARCHQALAADAPRRARTELVPAFEAALADLGISESDGVPERTGDVLRFLPHVWSVAEVVLANNPSIRS